MTICAHSRLSQALITGFLFWFLNTVVAATVGPYVDRLKETHPRLAFIGVIHFFYGVMICSLMGIVVSISMGPYVIPTQQVYMYATVVCGNAGSIIQPVANDAALQVVQQRTRRPEAAQIEDENLVLTTMMLFGNILPSLIGGVIAFYEDLLYPRFLFVYIAVLGVASLGYMAFGTFSGNFGSLGKSAGKIPPI